MMRDRNYILRKNHRNLTNPFLQPHNGCLEVKKKYLDKYKKVLIFFVIEKFGVLGLRQKIDFIISKRVDHVIFVVATTVTSQSCKFLKDSYSFIEHEIFLFNQLLVNPTKHRLVPQHILLTDEEIIELKKSCGTKLPLIKKSDAIVRHFYAKSGQVFKIIRQNPPQIYYRQVIA